MIDDANSKFDKLMGEYNDLKGLFDKSMSTTKSALGRIDELQNDMRGGLLIKLGRGTAEELDRRVKILLQGTRLEGEDSLRCGNDVNS
jgi:hypothetical protein